MHLPFISQPNKCPNCGNMEIFICSELDAEEHIIYDLSCPNCELSGPAVRSRGEFSPSEDLSTQRKAIGRWNLLTHQFRLSKQLQPQEYRLSIATPLLNATP